MSSRNSYLRRVIDDELDELFPHLPAVHLDGPKGVGKTETARRRVRAARDLGEDRQLAVVTADPGVVAGDERPVLIDEWHRVPAVWDAVRRAVDADHSGGQWLLAGSAPVSGTHSGAGRIVTMRMRPMCLSERSVVVPSVSFRELAAGAAGRLGGATEFGLVDYAAQIVGGGFPGLLGLSGRVLEVQLDSYVDRIVDRDLPELGHAVRRPATLLAWLRAYAAATATTASLESIRDAATGAESGTPARSTTVMYAELLTQLRILDPVPAWVPSNNQLSRVAGAPKHHLVDPALAARLLGYTADRLTSGDEDVSTRHIDRPLFGRLFESLVALSIRTYAQAIGGRVFHMRTKAGRQEVDLIVETSDGGVVAFEVKLAGSIDERDVQHLHWLKDRLGDRLVDAVVINTGPGAYRRPDGLGVVPLALLGP